MNPPQPYPPQRTGAPFAALLCLVLAAAAHAATVRNGWVLDDVPVVRDNPALARGLGGVPDIFRTPSWPGDLEEQPARPLALATLSLERRGWEALGLDSLAQGFHVVNVLLHGLASMLLLGLLARACPHRRGFAVGTALVFAIHPLATGVVSSATGRADLLAVVFGLLALHAWLRYTRGRPATLPLCALSFLLALLSKEAAVGLPLVALVLDRAAFGLSPAQAVRRRWIGYLALAATLALWLLAWRGPGLPSVEMPEPGAPTRLLLGLEALGRQALAALVPVGLLPDRSVEASAGGGYALSGASLFAALLAGIGLLLAALLPARAGGARALKAVVCAAGGLALAQSLTLPLGGGLEDRAAYLLLPALAGLGGLALEVLTAARERRVPWLGLGGAALALVALLVLSVREAAAWRDDDALHTRLLAREPGHGPALLRRAERLAADAQRERAIASSLRSDDEPRVGNHRRASKEARAQALEMALAAARLVGMRANPELYLLLGTLCLDDDRPAEGEEILRRARALEPLLQGGGRAGTADEHARALRRAARIYAALGRAYLALARVDSAADAYDEAVRWDRRAARASGRGPDMELAYVAAKTLIGDGRFADGLPLLAEVASAAPDADRRRQAAAEHEQAKKQGLARLRELLAAARTFDAERRHKPALETYEEALRVDPGSVEAREKAAGYLRFFGRYPQAKSLVKDGLDLLDRTPPGPATDRERERLTTLLADLVRWEQASAEEEAREMREGTGGGRPGR